MDDEYFFIWQVDPVVMFGRNQLIQSEVNLDYCHSHHINIYRRKSGGGCVYADRGCMEYSFIVADHGVNATFGKYMTLVADLLTKAGIPAETSGRNDVLVGGHKVAGAAYYRTNERSVVHNTLLWHTDFSVMQQALTPPKEKLESRGVKSVRQRVGNVGDYTDITMEEFMAFCRRELCGDSVRTLSAEDMAEIEKIESYIESDAFVYGNNPRYGKTITHRFPSVGTITAQLELHQDHIVDINLTGDYFLIGDLDNEILQPLRHVPFTREAVAAALEGRDPSTVIRNFTTAQLLRLLFGRAPHVMKPDWLKVSLKNSHNYYRTQGQLEHDHLHTICESGLCPNRTECWSRGTATLMIGGDVCTRSCRFCNTRSGRPLPLDEQEPQHVAEAVKKMGLRYAVITSVDRDDLPDYGAAHWCQTIEAVQALCPETKIEVLLPDFRGRLYLLDRVLALKPFVAGHNMETVRRLTPSVRSVATYDGSLQVLSEIAKKGITCKTGIMLGLGETEDEIRETLADVRQTGCTSITIGQYLQPSAHHLPVARYVAPEEFARYAEWARGMGFTHVVSGPLVRSSYHAEE